MTTLYRMRCLACKRWIIDCEIGVYRWARRHRGKCKNAVFKPSEEPVTQGECSSCHSPLSFDAAMLVHEGPKKNWRVVGRYCCDFYSMFNNSSGVCPLCEGVNALTCPNCGGSGTHDITFTPYLGTEGGSS